jgi:hypothetical protein
MSETPLKRAKKYIPARFSGVPLLALPLTCGAVSVEVHQFAPLHLPFAGRFRSGVAQFIHRIAA